MINYTENIMSNPILEKFETPFETVPFTQIKLEHYLPGLVKGISLAQDDINVIVGNSDKPNFQNVCVALEESGHELDVVSSVFFNLLSAESNDEMQGMAKEFSPMLTNYSNDVLLNKELFEKIKSVYESKDNLNLNSEQMMLLEKQFKSFKRNGALLDEGKKEELRGVDQELSKLSLNFSDHVLAETNGFELIIKDQSELKGLTESSLEAAALAAKEKGYESSWLFTLDHPSFVPFMTYVEDRSLREKVYKAFTSRCFKGGDNDNQNIVKRMVKLRHQRANLLGYSSHAHFVLEERMAQKPEAVMDFLNGLLDQAKPYAAKEVEELKSFSAEHGGPIGNDFMPWDTSFWLDKLKKDRFSFDSEELKPYFKLENVIDGVFKVAGKLYGLYFKERKDIPTYHPDVKTFEVTDAKGQHVAVFYGDFFPRTGKRSGAWMTEFREQAIIDGIDKRPHVSNVCNFSKPTETKPSLLTFNEVTTLFHEFGHGLHGMLSKCTYSSLSGPNVYWDFVELPSQIFENWAFEKECLDLFASHYETGEKIPQDLIDKIKKTSNFHEGRNTLRQLSFALLDMAWHQGDIDESIDVGEFERQAMKSCSLLPDVDGSNMSVAFSHIFSSGTGGYSAGYYSYKWAEVLDADAFAAFKERGIFDSETAKSFRENILERGGTEDPMTLYKKFRGKEPSPEALLQRAFS
jgi:Zn-dependent oligopeptidase